jgi:protein-S-isoprenylcysteine O-methyltransferase Ste14
VFHDPYHWFPGPSFSTILAVVVLGTFAIDYAVPRWIAARGPDRPARAEDRSSFLVIRIAGLASIVVAVAARRLGWAVAPPAVQYAGLVLIVAALAFREWAIVTLGRFFSRTVRIEAGHKLVTDGPYRMLRHPAYTGMVLISPGIALALGTWVGAALALALMLAATMYRITVEERALMAAFGDEYRDYLTRTWRLFPGW